MAGLIPFNRNRRNRQLANQQDNFYNMLDDFFNDDFMHIGDLANSTFKVDVEEEKDKYTVSAELPGIDKNEIHLSFTDGKLLIAVEKDESTEQKEKNFIHKERRHSSMSRSIYLADGTAEDIKAKLNDGILKISIPRAQAKENTNIIDIE